MQALTYGRRERQAENLHDQEDQKRGQMDPWLDRQTPSAFSCLARFPHLPGKPPTAAAATIKPDSVWPLPPSPLLSLPPSLLQSSPLFKMSFCSCSPDSCSILEPALGRGCWVLSGYTSSWAAGGVGMGGGGLGVTWSLGTTLPSSLTPIRSHPQQPQGSRNTLGPSRAHDGLAYPVPLIESCPAPKRVLALSCLKSPFGSENSSLSHSLSVSGS